MKFVRADLIARVEAEIEHREQDAAKRTADLREKHQQNLKKYMDKTGNAWVEFANTIRRRQRNKQPVLLTDIPMALRDGRGGYVATWDYSEPDERVANTDDLKTLLGLLKATTDDEVTSASLERAGFRIASLFRA